MTRPRLEVYLVSLTLVAAGLPLPSGLLRVDDSTSGLAARKLWEGRKTIPIYFRDGDLWNTDISLPDLEVANETGETVELEMIRLSGHAEGRQVVTLFVGKERLAANLAQTARTLNRLTAAPISRGRRYNLHSQFGEIVVPDTPFSESPQLGPGAHGALKLSDILQFRYAGPERVDSLSCVVLVTLSGASGEEIPCQIPLTPYSSRGDYVFPVRGSVTVAGTPWNHTEGHRHTIPQEFAFDVGDIRRGGEGEWASSSPRRSSRVTDYFAFHREILAIGDGVVVAVGGEWPDRPMSDPTAYSIDRVTELTVELLGSGMDIVHAMLGNYVILDHENGEFSLYAHMGEGTPTVEVGDRVRQGDVIGKIGNTSNSTEPHLHFQLMDSAEFPLANGLPVSFRDLQLPMAPVADYGEANSLLYADYLFLNLPEIRR